MNLKPSSSVSNSILSSVRKQQRRSFGFCISAFSSERLSSACLCTDGFSPYMGRRTSSSLSLTNGSASPRVQPSGSQSVPQRKRLLKAPSLAELDSSDSDVSVFGLFSELAGHSGTGKKGLQGRWNSSHFKINIMWAAVVHLEHWPSFIGRSQLTAFMSFLQRPLKLKIFAANNQWISDDCFFYI